MQTAHLDFETRSEVDLKVVGLWNYARHPSTEIWLYGAAFDAEPVQVRQWADYAILKTLLDQRLQQHVAGGGKVVAHNAYFELEIWNAILHKRYGWPKLQAEQVECTMASALAMALPDSLDGCAGALGLEYRKDKEGHALMLRMARPRSTEPTVWWDDTERRNRLAQYCAQDVEVERAIHGRLMPLSDSERRVWLMDYRVNQRGFRVDTCTARAGVVLADVVQREVNLELGRVTNGAVQSASALAAMKEWIAPRLGRVVESLDKPSVAALLEEDLPDDVRKVLNLRKEGGRSSLAKLQKMIDLADEHERIHFGLQYHAAGTGRWGGRGLQPHNFVRDIPKAEFVEHILKLVRAGDFRAIDTIYGAPLGAISRCLRGFILAAD